VPFGISLPELLILLVVLLLVFGAKRLPEMGRSLGKGMREFKDGVSGVEESATTTPTPTSVELTPPASEPSPQNSPSASSKSVSETESERQPVS
jgi:sec-independent protein translocase protein TatA